MIENLETKFKQITELSDDVNLTIYPITEHIGFDIRTEEKNNLGEVFTPIQLIDKMLETSHPKPTEKNMDLCAGRGQFTIRMLRKFINENKDFNIQSYLSNNHWFNEFNIENAKDIIKIFGEDINLCIGDARLLKDIPNNKDGNWDNGIWIYDGRWYKTKADNLNYRHNNFFNFED